MDKMFFFSAKIKEFHFYQFIVEMSFDMVLDVGASVCDAVVRSEYAVDPFRIHINPLQTYKADNLYATPDQEWTHFSDVDGPTLKLHIWEFERR